MPRLPFPMEFAFWNVIPGRRARPPGVTFLFLADLF
jgi:hypothetical protein